MNRAGIVKAAAAAAVVGLAGCQDLKPLGTVDAADEKFDRMFKRRISKQVPGRIAGTAADRNSSRRRVGAAS